MRRGQVDRFLVLVAIVAMMASQVAVAAHACAKRAMPMADASAVSSAPCERARCATLACEQRCRNAQAASDAPKAPEPNAPAALLAMRLQTADASAIAARTALKRSQLRTHPPPAALLPVLRI